MSLNFLADCFYERPDDGLVNFHFKDEEQIALFKGPVRTAL
jgi:hypothetical protein